MYIAAVEAGLTNVCEDAADMLLQGMEVRRLNMCIGAVHAPSVPTGCVHRGLEDTRCFFAGAGAARQLPACD